MAQDAPQHQLQSLKLETVDSGPDASSSHGDTETVVDSVASNSEHSLAADANGRVIAQPGTRSHRPSISFNPLATTDEGHTRVLETPAEKSPPSERGPGRSMMRELVDSPSSSNDVPRANHRSKYERGQPRWPLLQTTVDQLAEEQTQRLVTSPVSSVPCGDGTSQMASEEAVDSPSTSSFPSLSNSGLLPSPTAREAQQSRSSQAERPAAGALRRASRRASNRTGSGSAKSPASQFLARWSSRDSSATRPEPDEDGQTIGDDNEYVIGKQVGFGGFSVVKEVYSLKEGRSVLQAVKIVRKQVPSKSDEDNEKLQIEFDHEVSIWRHLRHDNILPLLSVFSNSFATFCIIPMNTGGTLFDLVRSRRKDTTSSGTSISDPSSPPMADAGVPVPIVRHYLTQLAAAIRYLHEDMRIVHRDVKLENCLITNANTSIEIGDVGNVLLCDFGMSEFMADEDQGGDVFTNAYEGNFDAYEEDASHKIGPSGASTNFAGSLQYASPEVLGAARPLILPFVDMWAFGVVAFALLTAQLPFSDPFSPRLAATIQKGEWDRHILEFAASKTPQGFSRPEAVVALVANCLAMDAQKRWTVRQARASEFLSGN